MNLSDLSENIEKTTASIALLKLQIEGVSAGNLETTRVFIEDINSWFDESRQAVLGRLKGMLTSKEAEYEKLVSLQELLQKTLSDALKG